MSGARAAGEGADQTAPGEDEHRLTRDAWEEASQKHVREDGELLEEARRSRLTGVEADVLLPLLALGPQVLHPQSGLWRPAGVEAAAWDGRLPNSFTLRARAPGGPSPADPGPRRSGTATI